MSPSLLSPILALSGLEYAFAQPLLPGKLILWALIALSLISWAVILSKAFFFYRSRAADAEFTRVLRGARQPMQLYERHYSDAHSLKSMVYDKGAGEVAFQMLGSAERDATFAARLRSCDGLASHQLEAVREAFRRGEEAASARVRKGLGFISAAATGAPFLGLLGMVWILMKTFSQTGGDGFALPEIAPGVSGALAVMVVAMLVATPAIFAQIVLATVNREKDRQMGDFRAEAVRLVERFFCGVGSTSNRPLPANSPAASIAAAAAAAAVEAKQGDAPTRSFQPAPSFRKKEIGETAEPSKPEDTYEPEETYEPEVAYSPEAAYEYPQAAPELFPIQMPSPEDREEEAAALMPAASAEDIDSPEPEFKTAAETRERFHSGNARTVPPPLEPLLEEAVAEGAEGAEAPLPFYKDKEAAPVMAGPVYADNEGKPSARHTHRPPAPLELKTLRPKPRENPADTKYDTPFGEPELSPLAQQTAVLMARRRGPGAVG